MSDEQKPDWRRGLAKMNDRTKYPRGSPRDILVRLLRVERDVKQQLTDVQSMNDNNPHFRDKPMDVGRYLAQLKKTRAVIAAVRAAIAAGVTKLPANILKPICEPW